MNRSLLVLALPVLSLVGASAMAQDRVAPETRIALVVGNTDYSTLPDLPNARRDAALVAGYFADLGYRTILVQDADLATLQNALAETAAMTGAGTTAVFYFAGHGVQVGAANYILPADARIEGLYDLPFAALSLGHVMSVLSARAESALFILDSCRDNPYLATMVVDGLDASASPIEAGFFFQRSPIDTFVAFSTSPGELAHDGPPGGNSPFTQAFVANARSDPGADLSALLARTRREVYIATEGRQLPWETSSLTAPATLGEPLDMLLAAAGMPALAGTATRGAAETAPEVLRHDIEAVFDREVALGPRLADGVDGERGALRLEVVPIGGDLAIVEDGRRTALRPGDLVSGAALETLHFLPDIPRFSAMGVETLAREARFTLAGGGARHEVSLRLAFDPCDLAAGDVLDPGGVGAELYRYEMVPERAIEACREAVARDPGNARFRYQYARALMSVAELEAARPEVEAAVRGGHVRAILRRALLELFAEREREGLADRPYPARALPYLEQGVALGDPLADYALGRELLRYGEGAAAHDRGYALLMRAYATGYLEAISELGRYFLGEDGGQPNPDRAIRYFEQTAEAGNNAGQYSLGLIYRRGLGGVPVDPERARLYLEAAAENGHPAAPNLLGIIHERGEGVAPDPVRAIAWYDMALERGSPWGGANAAFVIRAQRPPGFTDTDAALRAGRAAAFAASEAADAARDILAALPDRALVEAAQTLLNEMGAELTVDGAFGPASRAALAEALGEGAAGLSADAPLDLLTAVARAHLARKGFRIDMI